MGEDFLEPAFRMECERVIPFPGKVDPCDCIPLPKAKIPFPLNPC